MEWSFLEWGARRLARAAVEGQGERSSSPQAARSLDAPASYSIPSTDPEWIGGRYPYAARTVDGRRYVGWMQIDPRVYGHQHCWVVSNACSWIYPVVDEAPFGLWTSSPFVYWDARAHFTYHYRVCGEPPRDLRREWSGTRWLHGDPQGGFAGHYRADLDGRKEGEFWARRLDTEAVEDLQHAAVRMFRRFLDAPNESSPVKVA